MPRIRCDKIETPLSRADTSANLHEIQQNEYVEKKCNETKCIGDMQRAKR